MAMHILCKFDNLIFAVEVEPNDTIGCLKSFVELRIGLAVNFFDLFSGEERLQYGRKLWEYFLGSGSFIHVVRRVALSQPVETPSAPSAVLAPADRPAAQVLLEDQFLPVPELTVDSLAAPSPMEPSAARTVMDVLVEPQSPSAPEVTHPVMVAIWLHRGSQVPHDIGENVFMGSLAFHQVQSVGHGAPCFYDALGHALHLSPRFVMPHLRGVGSPYVSAAGLQLAASHLCDIFTGGILVFHPRAKCAVHFLADGTYKLLTLGAAVLSGMRRDDKLTLLYMPFHFFPLTLVNAPSAPALRPVDFLQRLRQPRGQFPPFHGPPIQGGMDTAVVQPIACPICFDDSVPLCVCP